MTPYTAKRLFKELTNAALLQELKGIPIHVTCRIRATHNLGETKRELLRVAALGDGADKWMTIFLTEFDDVREEASE